MHNEATRREKLVREKSRKETTEKQNDRERKRENLKIYSAGNRDKQILRLYKFKLI